MEVTLCSVNVDKVCLWLHRKRKHQDDLSCLNWAKDVYMLSIFVLFCFQGNISYIHPLSFPLVINIRKSWKLQCLPPIDQGLGQRFYVLIYLAYLHELLVRSTPTKSMNRNLTMFLSHTVKQAIPETLKTNFRNIKQSPVCRVLGLQGWWV